MPTRPPAVAGTWYPGTAGALTRDVDRYLQDAPDWTGGPIRAVIAPHAGLMFSGPVAAHAYKAASVGHVDTVVLAGPSHYVAFDGVSIYPEGAFATPLGDAEIDAALAQSLMASPAIRPMPAAHQREHSLEMQLPFVRRLFPEARIVPLVMGFQTRETITALAAALAQACTSERVLLVASTDLSHFFDARTAQELDGRVARHVAAFDAGGLLETFEHYPRARARALCRLRRRPCHRGDDGGAVARRDGRAGAEVRALGRSLRRLRRRSGVSRRGVRQLLSVDVGPTDADGRSALPSSFNRTRVDRAPGARRHAVETGTMALPDVSGVFVTIKERGRLRGCLGTLQNRAGLAAEVSRCAADSASEDPRFPPVAVDELPDLSLEISVLGPLEEIEARPGAFTIGGHGLVVEQGSHRGLLLPQVATEWGWDAEQFLRQTCVKAGLPPDAWRNGARVFRFAAEVFGD
jgi:AmmeMemoRadiSam system protein B/AmmeMemoRadiSam system protein A